MESTRHATKGHLFQKTRFPSTTSDVASRGTLIIPARHTDVVAVRLEAIPTNGGGEFLRVKRRSILWNEDTDRTNEEEEEEEERGVEALDLVRSERSNATVHLLRQIGPDKCGGPAAASYLAKVR